MRIHLLWLGLLVGINSLAQKPEIFSTEAGAINGYDPVAYFHDQKPVKGNEEIRFVWNGATWHFITEQNLLLFKSEPEKFVPQYGGYCAFGLSRGYKASTQPEAWTILNGKLYLNYNTEVQRKWLENPDDYIKKADAAWPEVRVKK